MVVLGIVVDLLLKQLSPSVVVAEHIARGPRVPLDTVSWGPGYQFHILMNAKTKNDFSLPGYYSTFVTYL